MIWDPKKKLWSIAIARGIIKFTTPQYSILYLNQSVYQGHTSFFGMKVRSTEMYVRIHFLL